MRWSFYANILLLPFIAPAALFISGERESIEAVFLWPFVNWFVCLLMRYLRTPNIDNNHCTVATRRLLRWNGIVLVVAMMFMAVFEAGMAVCIQATDTPKSAWALLIAFGYLPHVSLMIASERILLRVPGPHPNEFKHQTVET